MIHVAARNGLLLALLDGMSDLAERSREITGREPGLLAGTIRAHDAIYAALAATILSPRDVRCSTTSTRSARC